MSGLEVTIDAESMQAAIVQAVADSTIGEHIRTAIEEVLKSKERFSSETILEAAAKQQIRTIIAEIVRETVQSKREEISALVLPLITDEVVKDMVAAAVEVMLGNLKKEY